MQKVMIFGALTALSFCVFTRGSWADGVTEVAVLKGDGVAANWIALSPDGTRLALVRHNFTIAKDSHQDRVPSAFEIWDVAGGTKICSVSNPSAKFNHLMFSANGSTLITFDAGGKGGGQFQSWDSATGREIGSAIVPHGEFAAAALSPDGKYLATIHNGHSLDENGQLTRELVVDELIVWDLAAHKARWRIKGSKNNGKVTWKNFLAFSPDGNRLAFYRIGNSPSETAAAPPGRRPGTINPLRMLTLAADKDTPVVTVLADPITHGETFEWPTSGRFLLVRSGRDIEALDATTGKSKGSFVLPFPRPPAPKPSGNAFPQPTFIKGDRPHNDDLPDGWHEEQTVLSANGARFAGAYSHGVQHGVVIWDTPGKKVLGSVGLPDRPKGGPGARGDVQRGPGGSLRVFLNTEKATEIIALSGNGGRLAVSDTLGTVRVYDVSKISGRTKVTPGVGSAATTADAADIRQTYERSVAKAREGLIKGIETTIDTLQTNARFLGKEADEKVIARLNESKDRFAKTGLVPWNKELYAGTNGYLRSLEQARAHVVANLAGAPVPNDLRELMDKQVVARWEQPKKHTLTLYANGKVDDPAGPNTWSFDSGRFTFRMKDPKAPGGHWVFRCDLAADGLSYTGFRDDDNDDFVKRKTVKVSGILIRGN